MAINKILKDVLDDHRNASFYWDFIASENSLGFHSPQESMRLLNKSIEFARTGQLKLVKIMQENGIAFTPTSESGVVPVAPEVIDPSQDPLGSVPAGDLLKVDQDVEKLIF